MRSQIAAQSYSKLTQIGLRGVVHATVARVKPEIGDFSAPALPWPLIFAKAPCFKLGSHFPRNLAPNLTQYRGEHRKEGSKTYEPSR